MKNRCETSRLKYHASRRLVIHKSVLGIFERSHKTSVSRGFVKDSGTILKQSYINDPSYFSEDYIGSVTTF